MVPVAGWIRGVCWGRQSAFRARRITPRSLLLLIALLTPAALHAQAELPHVHVIATGGTISNADQGRLTGDAIVASVPGLDTVATLTVEQFSNIPSGSVTPAMWLQLSHHIADLFRADPELRGVIITHGTDTMEETAFFLDLTVPDPRPVVITGAMRNPSEISNDGPGNLWDAVHVVLSGDAIGRGTMLVLNDEIFPGREVTKTNTSRLQAFEAPGVGTLGVADPDRVYFRRPPTPRPFPRFDVAGIDSLPRVDIVYAYAGADGAAIDAFVDAGARGLVLAAVGRGGMTPPQNDAMDRAQERGVFVAVSSRTGSGRVPVGGEGRLRDWTPGQGARFGAGDLNVQKARILLMLALSRTDDPREIMQIFRNGAN